MLPRGFGPGATDDKVSVF